MSLELALEKNTAAIEKLIAILANPVVSIDMAAVNTADVEPPATVVELQPVAGGAGAPKAKRTKKEAAPATAGEPAAEPSAPAPATGAADASETAAAAAPVEAKQVTYTEASAAVIALANSKGRKAAVDVLASFGAKTLGEVKASSYADVIAACQAVK